MARKNRTPEENARREKIRELLQIANIGSMDDIQNLFKETIAEFMENGLDAELDDELGYSKYDYKNKGTDNSRNGHSSKTLRTSFGDVGFFQLSAGKNAALVSVCHYLEYHSRVGDRFSSSGRIRRVQFPVIQFLKLGTGHSDGCILWQFHFTAQYKNQLIISLNCGILSLRFRVFHGSLILTQKTTSAKPFWGWSMWFFHGRILQQALFLSAQLLNKIDFMGRK